MFSQEQTRCHPRHPNQQYRLESHRQRVHIDLLGIRLPGSWQVLDLIQAVSHP